ncbi:MAG: urease accessory protein UreH domain-containing protein [Sulfobacillus sp.]
MLNLWDPHVGLALGAVLVTAFLLGVVHGVTPDEHTWPITFSYAIGSYSTKRGMVAGLTFSAAFTLQRAIASELAYLTLDKWFTANTMVDYAIYVVVGVVMVWAAWHLAGGRHWHLGHTHQIAHDEIDPRLQDPRPWMPAVHGFIAGWGFGAFAIIIYTVLAPAMPSALWGWVPGAMFGLGTMAMQVAAGGLFGWISQRMKLTPEMVRQVALTTAVRTLGWGGAVFVLGGALGLIFPGVAAFTVSTGVHIHNLSHISLGTVLVMISVLVIGVGTLIRETRHWSKIAKDRRPTAPGRPSDAPSS